MIYFNVFLVTLTALLALIFTIDGDTYHAVIFTIIAAGNLLMLLDRRTR